MTLSSNVHILAFSCRVVEAFDEAFYLLGILALEVQSLREIEMGLVYFSQLLVNFSEQHGNGRFLGHQTLKSLQFMNGIIKSLQFNQGVCLLIFVQSVLRVEGLTLLEVLQCLSKLSVGC
jgi:hypothetical protein